MGIQESMHVQLMSWTGSNLKWEVTEQRPHQLQRHLHQLDADLPNGLMINGVTTKTTALIATGMEVPAATMTLVIGTTIAQLVNALIPMLEQLPLLRLLA